MNERIKELRKSLGLTLEKFGERLGVGKTAINKIEKGENKITPQMFKSICREFGVREEWLREGTGSMFTEPDDSSPVNVKERVIGAVTIMDGAFALDVWQYIQKNMVDKE